MRSRVIGIITLLLVSLLMLTGCGSGESSQQTLSSNDSKTVTNTDKQFTIAASFYPMYIAALNVAKDIPNVEVVSLTEPTTGCLHDYSLTPDDMKRLEKAQVLIINGAGMESFVGKIASQKPDLKIIEASKDIPLIKGDGDEGDNPHVWLSITDEITQVKNIGDQLAVVDPDNASKYQENVKAYITKLEALKKEMHNTLDKLPQRNIITFHEAFPYFAKEFNLNIVGVIEREPGSAPSAKDLQETIEKIKELKIGALFAEPQYPAKAADTIAEETGSKVYILDPIVTGPLEADAYINIMKKNMLTLQEALR